MNGRIAALAVASLFLGPALAQAASLNSDVTAMQAAGTHQFYVYCSGGVENDHVVKVDGTNMKDAQAKAYAAEKAKIEARKYGHSVTEQRLADGSIKLTIQVAGGAA